MRNIDLPRERNRIGDFIRSCAHDGEVLLILVSGGLDSDVVSRICTEAVGPGRIHLSTVLQDDMDPHHPLNAHNLAKDLGLPLAQVDLRGLNSTLVSRLQSAEPQLFDASGLLDPARAKCSLRSALIASYEDKGMLVAGTSNRSEIELGFYMPFGDNLSHFKPIAHLYKTEVAQLGRLLGCREEVLAQEPSAGFWKGQSDKVDLAYWMVNGGPIRSGRQFSDEETRQAEVIAAMISQGSIDEVLYGLSVGLPLDEVSRRSSMPAHLVNMISSAVGAASRVKAHPLLVKMEA